MLKIKEWHKNKEKRKWKNGTITYDKRRGWFYHEKDAVEDVLIYSYLLRDVRKVFPE